MEVGYSEHLLGISLGPISGILAVKGNSINIGKQISFENSEIKSSIKLAVQP